MSEIIEIGEALVRHLNKLDDDQPGAFSTVPEIETCLKEQGLTLPDHISMSDFVKELQEFGWLEINHARIDTTNPSYRITARGQNRASSSINYADVYKRAVDNIPMAPDSTAGQELDVENQTNDRGFSSPLAMASEGMLNPRTSNQKSVSSATSRTDIFSSQDSSMWTGRKIFLADAAVIREIKDGAKRLRELIYETRFESNSDSQDLKNLSDALVAVCEMTEPDVSIIDRILSHPKFNLTTALVAAVATIRGALGI
ncbi:hypothetical protein GCM10009096_24900 [Parasphingorhabdus litoris]|uniref:Uncharacterized protein n=1 Tax=Parasphingorhabdus litoris TaxID=394733 RepID=A0ABP3KNP9_9SPHN|nr:hypothetical protein [Parasphingorhabdus litoris]